MTLSVWTNAYVDQEKIHAGPNDRGAYSSNIRAGFLTEK